VSNACGSARRVLWDRHGLQMVDPVRASARDHLGKCAACRAFVEENDRLARLVRESVFVAAPAGLRDRLFETVAVHRTARSSLRRLRYLAAAMAVLVVAAFAIWRVATWDSTDTALLALAADHARTVSDERLESSDARVVEAWLTARVGYAVFVPQFAAARLVGARICLTQEGRGAVIEYDVDGRRVSYFILLEASSAPLVTQRRDTVHLASAKGYSIAHWRDRGLRHAFVGNLPNAYLQRLAHECIEQSQTRPAMPASRNKRIHA
jgi:anti-sigma factor RsiW